jgi:hypothetical protein
VPRRDRLTLLSPPQRHAAFGTMSHTVVAVDKGPVCRSTTLTPPRLGRLGLDFGGVCNVVSLHFIFVKNRTVCAVNYYEY